MKKINGMIAKAEIAAGVVLTAVIVLLVFISAITRAFGSPIVWSVDFAQLLFVWISMLGADVALKYKAHIGVDLLVRKFPHKAHTTLKLVTNLLMVVFIGFIVYWGVTLCIQNVQRSYQTLGISYSYSTAAVPIIGILMILTIFEQIVEYIRNWNNPEAGDLAEAACGAEVKE